MDERLVARDEPVPPGEQVPLEHALHEVLAERLDHAARTGQVLVERMQPLRPRAIGHVEHRPQPVGEHLVGTEEPHVVGIAAHELREPFAEDPRRLRRFAPVAGIDVEGERVDPGQIERPHDAAVRDRGRAHPQVALRPQRVEVGHRASVPVEELLGPVRAQPRLEHREVLGVLAHAGERNLVRAEGALHLHAVDHAGAGPALGRAQHDGGPPRGRLVERARGGIRPDRGDALVGDVDRVGHPAVHRHRVLAVETARDEQRLVAVAAEEVDELRLGDAREQGRVGDLVPVEVQDRQHGPVGDGVEERVSAPARGERTGLGLAVAHHARDHQAGVVERRAEGVHERVAELAALVDGPGCLGRRVRRDAAGERELAEEPLHALPVVGDGGEQLGVRAVEPRVGDHRRTAVTRPADVERGRAALDDGPIEVRVDEAQAGRGAPVAEQARLDVVRLERALEQRVAHEVDLAHAQVVRRAPPGVDRLEGDGGPAARLHLLAPQTGRLPSASNDHP